MGHEKSTAQTNQSGPAQCREALAADRKKSRRGKMRRPQPQLARQGSGGHRLVRTRRPACGGCKHLEDIMEITRLKAAYCDAVDGGWDRRTHRGEEVAALFVDDGVWDVGGGAGRGEGHDGIVKLIDSFQHMPFAFHRVSNPVIHVKGDRATGKWHLIAYLSQPDGTPVMYFGVYHDRFVRTPQGWKFKLLTCDTATMAPLREGWSTGDLTTRSGFPENGPRAS